jgi:hypothetical protein
VSTVVEYFNDGAIEEKILKQIFHAYLTVNICAEKVKDVDVMRVSNLNDLYSCIFA